MLRKAVIVVLSISALVAFALTIISYRLDFTTSSGYLMYGWNPNGIAITKRSMLFLHANRGELRVIGHHYISPSRAVSPVSLDWWVLAYRWDTVTLRPQTVERDKNRGRKATSHRLFWVARVHLWLLFVLFAAYPAIAFIRGPLRRYRRRSRGLCLRCGYSLRGLTEPRCPECSTDFDPSTLASPPD